MSSVLHQAHVLAGAIHALPVLDRPLEHVAELGLVAEEVRANPVDHAPVLQQVVLQRVARQHDPSLGFDQFQSL